jgi:hypothetical protein
VKNASVKNPPADEEPVEQRALQKAKDASVKKPPPPADEEPVEQRALQKAKEKEMTHEEKRFALLLLQTVAMIKRVGVLLTKYCYCV